MAQTCWSYFEVFGSVTRKSGLFPVTESWITVLSDVTAILQNSDGEVR